jgi:cbb3-type cytochrome oxidase cytochrome c subunit
MNRHTYRCYVVLVVSGACLGIAISSLQAQRLPSQRQQGQASPQKGGAHGDHQTPEGWHFTWPQGDPVKGREVFVKLECYSCHAVQGEQFPAPSGDIGPELAAMGQLHDAEYFAEAIINPSVVIQAGKGYEAADGTSKMPSYNDLVTVQEVVDLVAYLKGLKPPVDAPASHGRGPGSKGGDHTH